MPAALLGDPFLDFDFSKYCFRAIAVPAALFGSLFFDFDFSKYNFRAIAVPAALFGGPFLDFDFPKYANQPSLSYFRSFGRTPARNLGVQPSLSYFCVHKYSTILCSYVLA